MRRGFLLFLIESNIYMKKFEQEPEIVAKVSQSYSSAKPQYTAAISYVPGIFNPFRKIGNIHINKRTAFESSLTCQWSPKPNSARKVSRRRIMPKAVHASVIKKKLDYKSTEIIKKRETDKSNRTRIETLRILLSLLDPTERSFPKQIR